MTLANWKSFRLDELCEVRIGRTPRRDNPAYWGGDAVWVTIRELDGGVISSSKEHVSDLAVETVMSEPVREGTLLFSFKLSIGKMGIAGCPLYTNEAIAALPIRDPNRLSSDFLRYALMATSHEGGANNAVLGKVLNKEKVSAIRVPLPPLDEQHRIVRILNEAEALRQLRARADERMVDFIPALFNQMFGDPTHLSDMKWPFEKIDSFAEVSYGLADKLDRATTSDQGTRIITISNVALNGEFDLSVERYSLVDEATRTKARLQQYDLLFNWRNGSEQHVGKTALWIEQIDGEVLHVSFLLKIRPNCERVNPYYLWVLINRLRATGYFTRASRFQVNTKFNASELAAVKLPIPPLALQREFAARVAEARALQDQQVHSRSRLEAGFQAVLHRAFQGEL